MGVSKESDRYVGHSNESSIVDALQDAVNQALTDQNVADGMVEYEVVKIRGRAGGIAGFRDVWVEISVGAADKDKDKDKEEPGKYTTMAVGEEGGNLGDGHASTRMLGEEGGDGSKPPFTTLAVGEEGGDDQNVTTMALGEEGGETTT
jgi:hypothetical protein